MSFFRYILTAILITFSHPIIAAHLADDIEAGDGTNEIQLPLTRQSAAELIRLESNGKVLSVNKQKDNKRIFLIKVLHDNGKIKIYTIDSETGHAPD